MMSNSPENNEPSKIPSDRPPKIGSAIFFYVGLIALLLIFSTMMFGNRNGGADKTTLSDVVDIIENSDYEVKSVDVNGTTVSIEYTNLQGLSQTTTEYPLRVC